MSFYTIYFVLEPLVAGVMVLARVTRTHAIVSLLYGPFNAHSELGVCKSQTYLHQQAMQRALICINDGMNYNNNNNNNKINTLYALSALGLGMLQRILLHESLEWNTLSQFQYE